MDQEHEDKVEPEEEEGPKEGEDEEYSTTRYPFATPAGLASYYGETWADL